MSTKQQILWRLLARVKAVGGFRAVLIGFIFPEFRDILGDLSELGGIVDREGTP